MVDLNSLDGHSRAGAPHFRGGTIDDVPRLLEQSYRLRYEVYCLERKFLPAEDYPTGLEIDEFDGHSLHVGAVDASGELAGTSRAVKVSEMGLPLFDHCTSFPHETEFNRANPRLVEVGRLVVAAATASVEMMSCAAWRRWRNQDTSRSTTVWNGDVSARTRS